MPFEELHRRRGVDDHDVAVSSIMRRNTAAWGGQKDGKAREAAHMENRAGQTLRFF